MFGRLFTYHVIHIHLSTGQGTHGNSMKKNEVYATCHDVVPVVRRRFLARILKIKFDEAEQSIHLRVSLFGSDCKANKQTRMEGYCLDGTRECSEKRAHK